MKKLAVFISGRGSNMQAILEECKSGVLKETAEVVLVFSNNAKAKGLELAQKAGIPTAVIPHSIKANQQYEKALIDLLKRHEVEWIILAGYMRILSPPIIAAYPQRVINIHPADTNLHQGLGGYQWAFDNKLPSTIITVHYVSDVLDRGAIIAQKEVDLIGAETVKNVEQRGLAVEHVFYSQTLYHLWK
jgi:phosphoribosylglycinamide formyltransferase-1